MLNKYTSGWYHNWFLHGNFLSFISYVFFGLQVGGTLSGHQIGLQLMEILFPATILDPISFSICRSIWECWLHICCALYVSEALRHPGLFGFFSFSQPQIMSCPIKGPPLIQECSENHIPPPPPTPRYPWLPSNSLQLFFSKQRDLNPHVPLWLFVITFSQIPCYLASIMIRFQ